MHDQSKIAADPYRQEVRISRFVEFVQLHAGLRRVHLQVESGDFHCFLLLASKPRQALRERIGNAEFHGVFSSYPCASIASCTTCSTSGFSQAITSSDRCL